METASEHFSATWGMGLILPTSRGDEPRFRLPPRLVWLCQIVRIAALAQLAHRFFNVVNFNLHRDWMIESVRNYLHLDISGMSSGQMALAAAINLVVLFGLQFGVYFSIFQLFTGFLRGEIFTVDATLRLRRAGLFALAYIFATPLREFLVIGVVTSGLPDGGYWAIPPLATFSSEIYDVVLGGTAVALAEVLKFAAELARESEEIL